MRRSVRFLVTVMTLSLLAASTAPAQSPERVAAEQLFVDAQKALSRGEMDRAEALLMDALKRDPTFTSAVWQLAQIYEHRGKLDYARELLLRGLEQEPSASWARERLSQLEGTLVRNLIAEAERAIASRDFAAAAAKLNACLGIKPKDMRALILMGKCQIALGNPKAAREYLGKALDKDPSNREAADLVASLETKKRDTKLDDLVAEAQLLLIHYTPDKKEKTVAALEAVLEADPSNAWARERLEEVTRPAPPPEEQPVKRAPQTVIAEKGRSAFKSTTEAMPRVGRFALSHLVLILLAVVLAVLTIDVRRRALRRTYPLQGTLSLIPILDIVALVNSNLKSGRLIIVNAESKGEIYFEKGEIIHARWKNADGKKAFHAMMELRSGRYFFHNHLPNVRHTIAEPLSMLLLSMKSRPEEREGAEREREEALTPAR
jgi:Tfp pilus assembly protein PilF